MQYQYKREPLTADEQDALVKACRTSEEKLVIWTLLDTGMRVSEVSSLTKDNFDFQSHRVTFFGKGRKRRQLELTPRLRELLEPHIISNDVFGISVRTIQRIVLRVARHAKIRRATSPHVLRHTFAVRMLRRGMNLRSLMGWLGHESIRTTELYLNLSPEDVIADFRKAMG